MHSSLIGKVEKANRYAHELDRRSRLTQQRVWRRDARDQYQIQELSAEPFKPR